MAEHDHAHGAVGDAGSGAVERGTEVANEPRRERVAVLGGVERDRGDLVGDREMDELAIAAHVLDGTEPPVIEARNDSTSAR